MKTVEPKRWRVVGVSDDKLKVTLGRYETKEEAERDSKRYINEGFYGDVTIIAIDVPPPPEEDSEKGASEAEARAKKH